MSTTIAAQLPPVALPTEEPALKQPNQHFIPRALSASKTRSLPSIFSKAENILPTLKSTKPTYHAYSTFDLAFPSKVDRWQQKTGQSWIGIGTTSEEETDGLVEVDEVDGQSHEASENGLEIGGVVKRVTRQMRHDQAIQDFHKMTERIGGQIKKEIERTISDFRKQLETEILELNATFETVTSPCYLRSLSKDVLSRFWSAISDSSNQRLGQIDHLETQLEELEAKRAQKLQREVRLFDATLREIGWLGGRNLKSLLEDHVAKLNISVLTNRSNVTHWCAQLRIENVRQSGKLKSQYETNVTQAWKKLRVEYLSETYRKSVKSTKFPERREALEAFRTDVQEMHKLLVEHLTSIHADTLTPSTESLEQWNQKSQSLLNTIKPHFQSFLRTIKSHTPERIAASLDTLTTSYRAGLIECDVPEEKIQEDIDGIMQQIIDMEGYSVGEDAVEGIPVTALTRYMDFEETVINDFGAYLLDVAELWSEHQSDLSKLNATIQHRFHENEELYHRDVTGLQNLLNSTLRDSTKEEEAGTALEVLVEKINAIMLDMEKAHRNFYESGSTIMKSVPEATRKRIEIYREKLLNFFEMSLSPDDVRFQKTTQPTLTLESSTGTRPSSAIESTNQRLAASSQNMNLKTASSQNMTLKTASNQNMTLKAASSQNMNLKKGSFSISVEPLPLSEVNKPTPPSDTLMSDVTGTIYYIWEVLNEAELLREKCRWWKELKSQEVAGKVPSVAFQPDPKAAKEIGGKERGAKNKPKFPEITVSDSQDKTQGSVTVPSVLETNRSDVKPFTITEYKEISNKLNFPSLPQQVLTSVRREAQKAYLEQLENWESTTLQTAFHLVQARIDEMVNALNERLYRHSFMETSIREQANQQKAVQVVERQKHVAREIALLDQTTAQIKQAYTKAVQEVEEKTAEIVATSKKFGQALRKTRTLQGATKIRTDYASQNQSHLLYVKDTISRAASVFDENYFQMKIRRHNVNAGNRVEYNLDGFIASFSDRLDGFRKKSEQALNALNDSVELRLEDLKFLEAASRSWGKLQITVMAEMSKNDSASKELNAAVQSIEKSENQFKGQIATTDNHEYDTYVHILRLCDETRQTVAKRGIYLGCLKKADPIIAATVISFSAWKEGTESLAYAKAFTKGKPKSVQNEKPRKVGTSAKKIKSPDTSTNKLEALSTIVEKLITEAKDSAVIAGEEYYKKKGIRPISCVEKVPVNLSAYVIACSEKAEELKSKYEAYRKKLVAEYRSQVARLWKAWEELTTRLVMSISLHSQQSCAEILERETSELGKELAKFKIEKTQHWQQLSPSLSHPDNSAQLDKLNAVAKLTSSKIVTVADEFQSRVSGRLERISEHFIEGLLFTTITLVKILNSTITMDVIEKPEPDEESPQRIPIRELLIQPSPIPTTRPPNVEPAHKQFSPANSLNAPGTPTTGRRLSSSAVVHTPEYKSLDFGLCPFPNLKHLDPRGSFSGPVGSEKTYKGIEEARNRSYVEFMNRVERDLDWFKVVIGKVQAEEEHWMGAWKASVKQLASIQM